MSQDYVNGTDQEEIRTGERPAGGSGIPALGYLPLKSLFVHLKGLFLEDTLKGVVNNMYIQINNISL